MPLDPSTAPAREAVAPRLRTEGPTNRRANLLLAAGAAAGLAVAAAALVRPGGGANPAGGPRVAGDTTPAGSSAAGDALATVNGQAIPRTDYLRAIAAIASDRRTPLDDPERRRILDRLIDEELLLQRAIELGLVRRDSRTRNDLVAAMIDTVVAEANAREPGDGELEEFYRANGDLFAESGRTRVRQVLVEVGGAGDGDANGARARADALADRLRAGEDFDAVARDGDPQVAPVPDTLLPPAKVVEYLGPSAARAALALEVGEVSAPVRTTDGWSVLQVVEKDAATVPGFDEIAETVRAQWVRHNGNEALASYLGDLRRRAAVVAPDALP